MITIKAVNKAIASRNIKAELVRGSGYFYFVGPDVEYAGTTSVMVPRLNDLTLAQWIEEAVVTAAESKERLEHIKAVAADSIIIRG